MLSTKLLPESMLKYLKKNTYFYNKLKNGAILARSFLPKMTAHGMPGKVHPNDFMLKNYTKDGLAKYKNQSQTQFQLIDDALTLTNRTWSSVDNFIDIGCGYGRILRWATETLPAEKITACDVIPQAAKFCAKEFGVKSLVTDGDLTTQNFESYDLTFSCSVLTHLSPKRTENYLKLLNRVTKDNAVIIFSIHGHASLEYTQKINGYLSNDTILEGMKRDGIYFHPYPHYLDKGLGDTFFTIDYLQQKLQEHCPQIKIIKHFKGPCYGWQHDWIVCKRENA